MAGAVGLSGRAVARFLIPAEGMSPGWDGDWHSVVVRSFWAKADLFTFGAARPPRLIGLMTSRPVVAVNLTVLGLLSGLLSALTYRYVERPALRRKTRQRPYAWTKDHAREMSSPSTNATTDALKVR